MSETFGQMVYRLREEVWHWKQKELARRTGLDQSTISAIERDRTTPRAANITLLAAALGFDAIPWLVSFGHIPAMVAGNGDGGSGDGGNLEPAPVVINDKEYDPSQIVRFVRAHPDKDFQAQLDRQEQRRSPASFEWLCLRIFRAWTSNAELAMFALEPVEK